MGSGKERAAKKCGAGARGKGEGTGGRGASFRKSISFLVFVQRIALRASSASATAVLSYVGACMCARSLSRSLMAVPLPPEREGKASLGQRPSFAESRTYLHHRQRLPPTPLCSYSLRIKRREKKKRVEKHCVPPPHCSQCPFTSPVLPRLSFDTAQPKRLAHRCGASLSWTAAQRCSAPRCAVAPSHRPPPWHSAAPRLCQAFSGAPREVASRGQAQAARPRAECCLLLRTAPVTTPPPQLGPPPRPPFASHHRR